MRFARAEFKYALGAQVKTHALSSLDFAQFVDRYMMITESPAGALHSSDLEPNVNVMSPSERLIWT
jgi:hypothetical protein